jgi:hypothetical protein
MYDATAPEVLEELDPDYVPPAYTPKAKAATAAQLKARIEALEGVIHNLLLTYHDEARDPKIFNEARKVLEAKP